MDAESIAESLAEFNAEKAKLHRAPFTSQIEFAAKRGLWFDVGFAETDVGLEFGDTGSGTSLRAGILQFPKSGLHTPEITQTFEVRKSTDPRLPGTWWKIISEKSALLEPDLRFTCERIEPPVLA